MKLSKRKTLKTAYANQEFSESEFIPYEGHWDSNTVITKNKELVMVMKLEGYSFETADDEDVDMRKNVRNTLLKSITAGKYALWFHTVRRKKVAEVEGEYTGAFCTFMDKEWREKHSDSESFINELYISVVQKKDTEGVAKVENALESVAQKADKDSWATELRKQHKDLVDLVGRMQGSLREYKPKLLGIRENETGVFSEILEFFGILVNCGQHSNMLVPHADASRYLPSHRLYFGRRAIEARAPTGKSFFSGAISIKEYAAFTAAGILDTFLQLPFELIITQSFAFSNRQAAISKMAMHQRRMQSAGDKAVSLSDEISVAMDMASSGYIGFGKHHLTVFVIEDDLLRMEKALSFCYGEMVNTGIIPSREIMNLQASYWAQLPGNFKFIARASEINTLNLAGFASLHNYPIGKAENNHWGPAVTVLDTTSGTPYFFNFHVRDVGHTMIIGPTGAGKTVMMNFLMAQAQKFKARMFFFDKDHGAEIFIRAIGGVYSVLDPGGRTYFNPLLLKNTSENRTFLVEWISTLLTSQHKSSLDPTEFDRIAEAIAGNFKMPREERTLHNIAPFLGLEGPGTLAGRLRMWHGNETHAGLFDNKEDRLDFSQNSVFGFEMGPVLADGISLGPILLYLFHKINLALDGTPTMIVLDEAWALIDNDVFAPKIKDWLKVLRKLNAMVIFATQSVEDASKSTISDTLVQQTATQIYLPNAKATSEYQKVFMLTDREFSLVKTTNPSSRFFLIKQHADAVIARVDLSGMDDIINVLSGRTETVALLRKIIDEVGEDPEVWLPVFYKRVKEMG